MKYAIIGDLHSSIVDLQSVLNQIDQYEEPLEIIGLGDLFECKIGKRKLATLTGPVALEDAIDPSDEFNALLTFPTVIGNQEERIAQVTHLESYLQYPVEISLPHATVKHGHQFDYTESFDLIPPSFDTPILFFGHSHYSAIYKEGVRMSVDFNQPIKLDLTKQTVVNVGSVVDKQEWVIYDAENAIVTFKKALLLK